MSILFFFLTNNSDRRVRRNILPIQEPPTGLLLVHGAKLTDIVTLVEQVQDQHKRRKRKEEGLEGEETNSKI